MVFSIYPLFKKPVSKEVVKLVETLQQPELPCRLRHMSMTVKGERDEISQAIRRCHQLIAQDCDRMLTMVTIAARKNQSHHLSDSN